MYLSVVGDTRLAVEAYVRSCCEQHDQQASDEAVHAMVSDLGAELGATMLEVVRTWAPSAAARMAPSSASEGRQGWVLDAVESRLRAAGLHTVEVDAVYQSISEAAERPDRRADVAQRVAGL